MPIMPNKRRRFNSKHFTKQERDSRDNRAHDPNTNASHPAQHRGTNSSNDALDTNGSISTLLSDSALSSPSSPPDTDSKSLKWIIDSRSLKLLKLLPICRYDIRTPNYYSISYEDFESLNFENVHQDAIKEDKVFKSLKEKDPKGKVFIKLYEFLDDGVNSKEDLCEFYIKPELKANLSIRNHNERCIQSNELEKKINSPTLICCGRMTTNTEEIEGFHSGYFFAFKDVGELFQLEARQDFDNALSQLIKLHSHLNVTHGDVNSSNIGKIADGSIIMLDYNHVVVDDDIKRHRGRFAMDVADLNWLYEETFQRSDWNFDLNDYISKE